LRRSRAGADDRPMAWARPGRCAQRRPAEPGGCSGDVRQRRRCRTGPADARDRPAGLLDRARAPGPPRRVDRASRRAGTLRQQLDHRPAPAERALVAHRGPRRGRAVRLRRRSGRVREPGCRWWRGRPRQDAVVTDDPVSPGARPAVAVEEGVLMTAPEPVRIQVEPATGRVYEFGWQSWSPSTVYPVSAGCGFRPTDDVFVTPYYRREKPPSA